jgi:hypothetical protein
VGLGRLIEAVSSHLAAKLPSPPALIGAVTPATNAELPAITASITEAVRPVPSLGRVPGPVMAGALRVNTSVSLAQPTLTIGDETVQLLSADRRTLQLPHGSVVRADGLADFPFSVADLSVRLGPQTFTPVAGPPASATDVQLDPAAGTAVFRDPLPATGALLLGYFVGAWEVRSERFKAGLSLEVFGSTAAAVQTLSDQVEQALEPHRIPPEIGIRSLEPVALGPIGPRAVSGGAVGRRIDYAVDFEHIEPLILTGGGPITSIHVSGHPGTEQFIVE